MARLDDVRLRRRSRRCVRRPQERPIEWRRRDARGMEVIGVLRVTAGVGKFMTTEET